MRVVEVISLKHSFIKRYPQWLNYFLPAMLILITSPLLAQDETGVCSYYGKKFHGRTTACGEKFNMYDYTAAHKKLPFNTEIKVTNLSNNRSVIVRINDRGPYIRGRILDLSYAAAREIGMIKPGTVKVKIETIGKPSTPTAPAKTGLVTTERLTSYQKGKYYNTTGSRIRLKGYGVQIISFSRADNLLRQYRKMHKAGYRQLYTNVVVVNNKRIYQIFVGRYKSRRAAEAARKKLSREYGGCLIRKY